ncbi:MAG: hypothetical protein ACXAEN_27105 [Candidatus Thorarchaeota archaeon]
MKTILRVRAKTLAEATKKAQRKLGKKYTITSGALDWTAKNKGKRIKRYMFYYHLKHAYQKPGKAVYKKGKRKKKLI